MNDILLTAIRDSLLPEFRQMIQQEMHAKLSEDLMEKYLSPDVVCKMFDPGISRGTLFNWQKAGYIKAHVIGGKKVFKYSEIVKAVEKLKKYSRNN